MGMTSSPCRECTTRFVGCHIEGNCKKWDGWREIHMKEKIEVDSNRMHYISEDRQIMDSCRRNKYFGARSKK